jgi:hypothetical protein
VRWPWLTTSIILAEEQALSNITDEMANELSTFAARLAKKIRGKLDLAIAEAKISEIDVLRREVAELRSMIFSLLNRGS